MSDELRQHLKGCLVLVTSDGEHFHRTRIAEVTPSGRHVRLENDEPVPGGLERWRALDSIQVLEAFASPAASSVMHGIVHLKNPSTRHRPAVPFPPIGSAHNENSNILAFPIPASADNASVRAAISLTASTP
ncbi:hypothetical protein CMV30_13035 [Nibricoccus aquaticus]|uniref:Uncharacterized protein n=2 Tax=Nibricoccus aquaticus TaxID=2576891 RepID=A0A290QEW9_9BACT|nr:hypothetical protein CMV30_13035 [Nibricoccus aquaticus]